MSARAAELTRIDLGDQRLNRRARQMLEKLGDKPTVSIPSACGGWGETRGAYRLFDHPEVTAEAVLAPHVACTEERLRAHPRVLCIQDTTELDYTTAALAQPDGVVCEVVFPVVSEQTLHDLVKEWKATGPTYRVTLRTIIRNSYRGHYRRMVPTLLAALEFHSNNERHQPVMEALDLVKRFATTKVHTFPADETVPLDGVVRGLWRDAVIEKDAAGRERVNRVTYEIAVLEALRERLRCKEIWVVGANRYGNPDDDLPTDFEVNREVYYQALQLPMDAERFITEVQAEMDEALTTFDAGLKKNRFVRLNDKGGGWITLTPLDAQPELPNLTALKAELNVTWPMTSLLDMVKEADLRLNFTEVLRSPTSYLALL